MAWEPGQPWTASVSASMGEVWLAIDLLPYEISTSGTVRRTKTGPNARAGKVIRPFKSQGYWRVALSDGHGGRSKYMVHRLMGWLFLGPKPTPEHQLAHRDCVETNNKLSNLRWATPTENMGDSVALKRHVHGSRHGMSKITEDDVRDMDLLRAMGLHPHEYAASFGVTPHMSYLIASRRNWKHVEVR